MDTYIIPFNDDDWFGLYAKGWRNSFGTPLICSGTMATVMAVRELANKGKDMTALDGARIELVD